MPIGIKGNILGTYTPPHSSAPMIQRIYNVDGELVFEKDLRSATSLDCVFMSPAIRECVCTVWDIATPYALSADYMFYCCTNLQKIGSTADFTSLQSGNYMFYGCSNLESICSNVPFGSLSSAFHMFENCTSLEDVCIDTPALVRAPAMFKGCTSLENFCSLNFSKLTYANQMFMNSGLTGKIGQSGYWSSTDGEGHISGDWVPTSFFTMGNFSTSTSTSDDGDNGAYPNYFFYGTKITEAYLNFTTAACLCGLFQNCSNLKKIVMKCNYCYGTALPDGNAYHNSGYEYFITGCSSLEICDIYSTAGLSWNGKQLGIGSFTCPKMRYFNINLGKYFTIYPSSHTLTNLITLGDRFTPTHCGSQIAFSTAKLSLSSCKKLLNCFGGNYKSSAWTLQSYVLYLGVGLQEGLTTRTTPSYVIDAGYYDYTNGSESTDPTYEHNYYDLDGNPVIEHDVHDPYISTEQPTDEEGNLLTTWSAVNNGTTYWAIGELRTALDASLGTNWSKINLYFN